jgi:hypothetical protein
MRPRRKPAGSIQVRPGREIRQKNAQYLPPAGE